MKESKIEVTVRLDENQVPESIEWEATDGVAKTESKAMLLTFWDKKEGNSMRMDLWTKEMTVDEMKMFYFQSFMTMADTFERATNESEVANQMKEFGQWFAEEMELELK